MNSISLQAHRQRGGTLVGFIVGLLIGLASALSVAIYVTRVPVPFVDRTVSRNPAEDVLEAERNKGWNPNAALAGKQAPAAAPAPQAPPEGAIVVPPADSQPLPPAPAPPAAAVPKVPAAPAATATTPAAKAPAAPKTADPLGDLAQSRLGQNSPASAPASAPAAAPAAASANGSDPFVYFVQAGAYRSPEDAETQRARLAMMGLSADVTEREQSGRTVFRVRLGPYSQKTQADNTRDQLSGSGVEAAVVRVQR